MTRKTVKHKEQRYVYYYCPTGKRNGCHSPPMITEDELLHTVTHKTRERIVDIERLHARLSKSQMQEVMQHELNRKFDAYDMKIRDLHRYKLNLSSSRNEGLLTDSEYHEYCNFYDGEISGLGVESSTLRKTHHNGSLGEDALEWLQSFLQFSHITEMDRFAVVKMILSIRVLATKEIFINFVCQDEYDQLICHSALGGHVNGAKKS